MHDPKMVEMVARAIYFRDGDNTDRLWEMTHPGIAKVYVDAATAALDALAAAGRLVTDGWKLVPMNGPTPEMRWATWEAQYHHINTTRGHDADEKQIKTLTARRMDDAEQEANDRAAYHAMLAAAPRAEDQA